MLSCQLQAETATVCWKALMKFESGNLIWTLSMNLVDKLQTINEKATFKAKHDLPHTRLCEGSTPQLRTHVISHIKKAMTLASHNQNH